jgi:hypothetical protein
MSTTISFKHVSNLGSSMRDRTLIIADLPLGRDRYWHNNFERKICVSQEIKYWYYYIALGTDSTSFILLSLPFTDVQIFNVSMAGRVTAQGCPPCVFSCNSINTMIKNHQFLSNSEASFVNHKYYRPKGKHRSLTSL